jgi:NADH dehydrogenase [ubiquinone] 1 alpha subcomplex assembly factor 6
LTLGYVANTRRIVLPIAYLSQDSELENPAHITLDSLIAHAESTSSTLFYLLLSLLRVPSDDLSHAASHLGAAQTISILLRAFPYHISKNRVVIPADITAKHKVVQEELLRKGPAAAGLEDAVFEFATAANDHLLTAREMFNKVDARTKKEAMPIFLSGVRRPHSSPCARSPGH